MKGCIKQIRRISHRYYEDVPVVVGVESAPKRTAIRLEYALRRNCGLQDIIHMKEVGSGRNEAYGLPKTVKTTADMVFQMRHLIKQRGVRYSRDYCSYQSDPTLMRATFEEQLRVYKFEGDPKTDKGKYTGKIAGRSDDLIISTMMGPFWSSTFKLSPRYRGTVRARGMCP